MVFKGIVSKRIENRYKNSGHRRCGVGEMVKQDEPREGFNRLQRERPRPDVVREGGAKSEAIRKAGPLGCLNARDEQIVDGVDGEVSAQEERGAEYGACS